MKKIYLVLFVILSIFVFSCKDNLISSDLSSSQNSGVGQVKVFVKQSRLIGPDVSDVDWTVELYKENDKFSGKNENGYYLFSGLSDGTYDISVSGKIDEVEKFTGSAQVTITNGNSVSVNVPIVAKKTVKENGDNTERTGYATIKMDMSEELLSKMGVKFFLHAELVGADDKVYIASFVDEENQIFLDNQQITFAYTDYSSQIPTTDIPAGYYNLSFVGLEDFGYSIKLKDNLVEIGDGLTTNIVLTENDYEIVRDYSTVLYVNENGVGDNVTGSSLSDPIAFSKITRYNYADLIYLLSDVEFSNEDGSLSPNIASFFGTISSFNSTVRTISANIFDYFSSITLGYGTTLKNIKLSGSNAFSFESLNIDETVILDCEMDNDSTVQLSKKSNLQIGQNFSGDLYLSLNGDWKLGDTVINFENGKPENSNFYIDSECGNSSGQNYSSMFYIDDSGKLAKYTDDFTSFAWFDTMPCLVTKTQAKNNTYTSIFYNSSNELNFTGISTYDEENQTWYFIDNGSDASVNTVPSLYKVSAPTEYTDSVTPEKICEVKLDEAGQISINVQDIYIYNDKIYLCNLLNGFYEVYVSNLNDIDFDRIHSTGDTVTALLVKNDVIYIATTFIDYDAQTPSTLTHSAIWRYKWDSDLGDTTAVDTYDQNGKKISVPYYLTQYDDNLTINNRSFPEGSTFRITDLYIDGTEVYGLLANYEDKQHIPGSNSFGAVDVYMRGSVFKLVENSSRDDNSSDPIMNATHLGLRKSFPLNSENLATAKQYFILPRKIVGILNKKLVIVDDGMVPDSNDCNVDRFVLFDLFDLADEISETIDVAVPFSTNGFATTSSPMTFYTINSLFN